MRDDIDVLIIFDDVTTEFHGAMNKYDDLMVNFDDVTTEIYDTTTEHRAQQRESNALKMVC